MLEMQIARRFLVRRSATLCLILALACTSCLVGPDYKTPSSTVAPQWSYLPTNLPPTNATAQVADAYWWKSLNDPVLNDLIDLAYRNNPTLQATGVSVLQARAQLNQSIGNLFPQQQGVSASVTGYRQSGPESTLNPFVSSGFARDTLLFSASWELDFWGKYRRTIQSDRASFLGTIASYDDALVTLIADVANSYVNIRTLQERIRVAQENADSQRESLRVATVQFNAGETTELDVQQAASVFQQTAAQVPRLQNSLNQAKAGLAVQLGTTADQVDQHLKGPGNIPSVPPDIAVGIPKDLLRRRPDVRAAGFAAAAQSALIGVARANMYPAFSINGAFGFTSNSERNNSLADMFMWQSRAAEAGASVVWPVFNYGRLINEVRVQDAVFQQAVLNYQNTVLAAQADVENGISFFYTEQQALTNLVAAATAARRSTQLSMIQYKSGEADFTTVLTSEQTQLSAEDSVASSQGNVVLALISIYRSLGGGWEIRQGHDVVSDEVKAEMARRTNWGKMLEPQNHLPPMSPEETP
ncbi:MAG TPA: transporter [Verrucomicrobiales bacterium]|nr:transporter [Verrucomicrobiales bacterium]